MRVDISQHPTIEPFFDNRSNTISYVVQEPNGPACAVIDAVMDINYAAGALNFDGADAIINYIRKNDLTLEWIIETHVHADHLSAAPYIQQKLNGKIGIGSKITEIQNTFGKVFNEGTDFQRDGSQFNALFEDNDTYEIGTMKCFTMHTPGHTPACMVHVMGNAAFVGDTLFMPDGGSARADFPGGDAGELYDSIMRVLALPDNMRLFICHDYGPGGRAIAWETTVAEEREKNIHVGNGKTREDFIKFRTELDAQLAMPSLIIPALQVNMRAGEIPRDNTGDMALKVPLGKL